MIINRVRLTTAILSLAVSFNCMTAESRLYRWVDDNGKVYYSDKVPPQHAKLQRAKLNKQAITVGVTEREKTRAQLKREEELAKLRTAQQQLLEEHKSKDRSLLRTFRSEREINDTLNSKLTTIEILSTVTLSNVARLEERIREEEKKAAERERNGQAVPEYLIKNIAGLRNQINSNQKKLANLEAQKLKLKNKFAADLQRFRALTATINGTDTTIASEANTIAADSEDTDSAIILSVVLCPNQTSCDKAWRLANQYIKKNATTPIRINTDLIIYTAAPTTSNDIALSISRITEKNKEEAKLFLDVRCQQSGKGQELCSSDKVQQILSSFRPYVEPALEK